MRRRHHPLPAADGQLVDRTRSGDRQAFGELYQRHRRAAESTAQWMLRSPSEVDDVVSDAFAGVLEAIRNGNGPRDNFRSYLLATVRNGCRSRWQRRERAVRAEADDSSVFEDPERYVEADTVARAFASLSPRWQQTLWLTEVEQRSAAEVAAHLHLAPNATAALAHRAREAFATAYLAEHIDSAHEVCQRYAPRLAAYVRTQLTDSQRDAVERHLIDCQRCQQAVNDLRDVNASLRKLVPPTVAALAAPSTVGISTLGTVSGLFSSGLLLKGAAAVLIATPLVLGVTGGSRGGEATNDDDVRVIAAKPLEIDEEHAPIVTVPSVTLADTAIGPPTSAVQAPTTTPSTTVVVEPALPAPSLGAEPSRSVPPAIDEIVPPGAGPVVDPVVDEVLVPVVDGVVVPLVDGVVVPVVKPVVDEVLVPVVDDVVGPVVDGVVVPVVDGVVVPVVKPVVDEVLVPVVDDVIGPVVDEVVVPVVDEVVVPVVKPVVDEVVVPVVDEVVVPVVEPVVDEVLVPVVDAVVVPVVDEVVNPILQPVLDEVVEPVVEPVLDEVVEPVVEPVLDGVVEPILQPVLDEVVEPVVEPVLDEVVEPILQPVLDEVVEPVVEPVLGPVADDILPTVDDVIDVLAPVTVPAVTQTPATISSTSAPAVTVPPTTTPEATVPAATPTSTTTPAETTTTTVPLLSSLIPGLSLPG